MELFNIVKLLTIKRMAFGVSRKVIEEKFPFFFINKINANIGENVFFQGTFGIEDHGKTKFY